SVCPRNPRLGAQMLPVADDAKATRPVVMTPRQGGRRPAPGRVTLVGIDVGREEDRELRRICDVPAEILLEHKRLAVKRVAFVVPEARVHMTRASDPYVVGLGHA